MKREQIFYSWMDDGDAKLNRYFIEECLQAAIKKLNRDTDITKYVVIRDTKGLAGMVDIGRVILERIQESAVFVADVSIINPKQIRREHERPTPNPNVMFELGYAYRAKGEDAIIAVFNTARGDVLELPFDVRPKRILQYHAASETDLAAARPELVRDFLIALKLCLGDTEQAAIARRSLISDALTEARLLASEIEDWPSGSALADFIKDIAQRLSGAIAQDFFDREGQALLHATLRVFEAAGSVAPTEENWAVIKMRLKGESLHLNMFARRAGFRLDDASLSACIERLRRASSKLREIVDGLAAQGSNDELVLTFERETLTVRRIVLTLPDAPHPKFVEALTPLSRQLRKTALVLATTRQIIASEIRGLCDDLDSLVARYYPAGNSAEQRA